MEGLPQPPEADICCPLGGAGRLLLYPESEEDGMKPLTGSCSGQGTHIFSVVGANVTGNCLNWTIEGGI